MCHEHFDVIKQFERTKENIKLSILMPEFSLGRFKNKQYLTFVSCVVAVSCSVSWVPFDAPCHWPPEGQVCLREHLWCASSWKFPANQISKKCYSCMTVCIYDYFFLCKTIIDMYTENYVYYNFKTPNSSVLECLIHNKKVTVLP